MHALARIGATATLAITTLLGAGCAARYQGEVASPGYYEPELVEVSPGVQVIADYDEPIFYSDRLYWRNSGGVWYRSPTYTGGWVVASPPPAVLRIDRPRAYVHYRPRGWVGHRQPVAPPPGRHYYGRPGFEPHRPPAPPPARVYQGPPGRDTVRPHVAPPGPARGVPARPSFDRRPHPPGR